MFVQLIQTILSISQTNATVTEYMYNMFVDLRLIYPTM